MLAFQDLSASPSVQTSSAGSHCTPFGGKDLSCPLVKRLIAWPITEFLYGMVACWLFQLGCLKLLHMDAGCPFLPHPSQPIAVVSAFVALGP
jgi:hypothetical protein